MNTIQEIFRSSPVRPLEIQILNLVSDHKCRTGDREKKLAVQHLLKARKRILDDMFVMTEDYKQLLSEFNEALKESLIKMRRETINMHGAALNAKMSEVMTIGKVFLGYTYPKMHPVQTMRAKKIWELLNGAYDTFMPLYEDGVSAYCLKGNKEGMSENHLLYLSETEDNWNEGFDIKKTSDMHLCYEIHNLIRHNEFSIFDILWVRDFTTEITCESSHSTCNDDYDDIDWRKCDYYTDDIHDL